LWAETRELQAEAPYTAQKNLKVESL